MHDIALLELDFFHLIFINCTAVSLSGDVLHYWLIFLQFAPLALCLYEGACFVWQEYGKVAHTSLCLGQNWHCCLWELLIASLTPHHPQEFLQFKTAWFPPHPHPHWIDKNGWKRIKVDEMSYNPHPIPPQPIPPPFSPSPLIVIMILALSSRFDRMAARRAMKVGQPWKVNPKAWALPACCTFTNHPQCDHKDQDKDKYKYKDKYRDKDKYKHNLGKWILKPESCLLHLYKSSTMWSQWRSCILWSRW